MVPKAHCGGTAMYNVPCVVSVMFLVTVVVTLYLVIVVVCSLTQHQYGTNVDSGAPCHVAMSVFPTLLRISGSW